MKVIGIAGKAQHGKTYMAKLLKEKLESKGNKVILINYADYLKYVGMQYMGWDGKKDEKGRTFLQQFGTEIVRGQDDTFWVETVCRLLNVLVNLFDYAIIADCRFPGEFYHIDKTYDTISLHIKRLNFDNGLTEKQLGHSSETALNGFQFDYKMECESGIDNLKTECNKCIGFLEGIGFIDAM